MKERVDIIISGGIIIDPKSNFIGRRNIAIRDGKIVPVENGGESVLADQVIHADGYFITPGLIDHHVHIYEGGSEYGFFPDTTLLPMGVTTAVDAGSAGAANFEALRQNVIVRSKMKVFAYLNISSMGQIGSHFPEQIDPQYYDPAKIKQLFRKYSELCGLKLRYDKAVIKDFGITPLQETLGIGRELDRRVVVHGKNPPLLMEDIVKVLRPGDVLCHCYQGMESTVLDTKGHIKPAVSAARNRGVVFDSADAKANYAYRVLIPALEEGFIPDIISTDLTLNTTFHPQLYGLPLVLSKYLNLRMPLLEVIRACTENPARLLGMEGRIGTLEEGAIADIALFELKENCNIVFENKNGECYNGNQLLVPKITILDGKIVYRQIESMFK